MSEKTKRLVTILSFFILGIIIVVSIVFFASNSTTNKNSVDSVSIRKDGGELVVSRDGSVAFTNENGTFFDTWDSSKTSAFFDYYDESYQGSSQIVTGGANSITINRGGQSYTYILDDDDELADSGGEDAQTPDGSSTPTPGSGGSGGTGGAGGSGGSGGSSGGGGGGPNGECLYWKLSYCVIARPPSPQPSPTGAPDPNANVIQANNCGEYLEGQTNVTIISNTVCIPEATFTP